jgi:hypothetical protein
LRFLKEMDVLASAGGEMAQACFTAALLPLARICRLIAGRTL